MAELREPPPPVDRSKYSKVFARLQEGEHAGEWVLLDTVRGGGLGTRLKGGCYVGLAGLTYDVKEHRTEGGALDVFIKITGREESSNGQ